MTALVTIMIGAGVLLILSALDNTSIVETLNKIINGAPINSSGSGQGGGQ